ncbi:MAG: aminoglycoside 3'-phosphotransferase [Actinomycetota bacterium]|nr:aminoglycoside 3'-phosphotransferase [Actinomycetota bacterium]
MSQADPSIDDLLAGLDGRPITVGLSGAEVVRWGDRFVVKSAASTWDRGLDAEAERLRWLATTPLASTVASVVAFEAEPPVERLVTAALPGGDLTVLQAQGVEPRLLARRFGRHLRQLHDTLDPASCPFPAPLETRLAAAGRRVAEGAVDTDDFEPVFAGRAAEDLLAELHDTRPDTEDLVVAHGDWCFPNVLLDGDAWSMCDLAGLGVSCRWYDLAIAARSTEHNVGAAVVADFWAGYGLAPEDVDHDRARWYLLLDELQ